MIFLKGAKKGSQILRQELLNVIDDSARGDGEPGHEDVHHQDEAVEVRDLDKNVLPAHCRYAFPSSIDRS